MLSGRLVRQEKLLAGLSGVNSRVHSTVTSNSGRVYTRSRVLQHHRRDASLSIFKAECGEQSFVLKRVLRPFYDLSQRLAHDFGNSGRLRTHIDHDEEETVLIFPYLKNTLLSLIESDPDFPVEGRMTVLRQGGEAIQELHSKDWVHNDIKPDNVLVNWDSDKENHKFVTDVALGDFDLVFKCENAMPRNTPRAVGNAMWRSPEGQTGRGVTKASDIYSFGLLCIYTLGGGDFLLLNNYKQLVDRAITPEQEILTRHFCYFGPVPEALFRHIGDEAWCAALRGASEIADVMIEDEPKLRFERWSEELGPHAVRMISGMTALDPEKRVSIERILTDPFWEEDE